MDQRLLNPKGLKLDSEFYNKEYFDGTGSKSNYTGYTHIKEFIQRAHFIQKKFSPKTVLVLGCAKGYLVEDLRKLGIEALGIDISSYAINHSPKVIRKFLTIGNIRNLPYSGKFDVIVSHDVLEHIPEEDVEKVIENIHRVCRQYTLHGFEFEKDDRDLSHVNIQKPEYWIEKFTQDNLFQFVEFLPEGKDAIFKKIK